MKAHQALHFLASTTHGRPNSSRGATRKMDVVGPFFENHVLGIMAVLADTINDGKGPQPNIEKIRCLGAIREMIRIAKCHVSNGLPQVWSPHRSTDEVKHDNVTLRFVRVYALPSATKSSPTKRSKHGS